MKKRILIIDDSIVALERIAQCLNQVGYKDIISAVNGQEGIEKAKSENFDLVVLDIGLPDLNGYDVCKKIKDELGKQIKVINITGDVEYINAQRVREVGADDFVVKTEDYAQLVDSVENLLR